MQDEELTCGQFRSRVTAYLEGVPCPELEAHLSRCEGCREALLEAALRRPLAVAVPANFRHRVLAGLPEPAEPESPGYAWVPALAACLFAALGFLLWWSGAWSAILPALAESLRIPKVWVAAAAMEIVLVLWLWRVVFRGDA